MSMELYAFLNDVPGADAWTAAMTRLDLPYRFTLPDRAPTKGGFCPMSAGGETSGVEIDEQSAADVLADDCLPPEVSQRVAGFARMVSFRWSTDVRSGACAFAAAAALVSEHGAVVYDEMEGETITAVGRLADSARQLLAAAGTIA